MMRRIRVYRVDVEKESGDWASEIFLKREGSKVNFDRMVFNKLNELHPGWVRSEKHEIAGYEVCR